MRQCKKCKLEFEHKNWRIVRCDDCRKLKHTNKCLSCNADIYKYSSYCTSCATKGKVKKSRGNRVLHSKGYVLIRDPDHPRASGGYVLEHILVMEKVLGRYIEREETIHHINGLKEDNRPENLELFTSAHPTGSRVSDLVIYAKEILTKYEPESLAL